MWIFALSPTQKRTGGHEVSTTGCDVEVTPLLAVSAQLRPGRICIKPVTEDEYISVIIRQSGCWEQAIVNSVLLALLRFPTATFLGMHAFCFMHVLN